MHILSFCPQIGIGWAEMSRVREVSKGFDLGIGKLFKVVRCTAKSGGNFDFKDSNTQYLVSQSPKFSELTNEIKYDAKPSLNLIFLRVVKKKSSTDFSLKYFATQLRRQNISYHIIGLDLGRYRINDWNCSDFIDILKLCPELEIMKFRKTLVDIEFPELKKLRKLICIDSLRTLDCRQLKHLEKIKIGTIGGPVYLPEKFNGNPTINNIGYGGKVVSCGSSESKFSLYICSIGLVLIKIALTLCVLAPLGLILLLVLLIQDLCSKDK